LRSADAEELTIATPKAWLGVNWSDGAPPTKVRGFRRGGVEERVMHAISLGVLVGFVAAAIVACGGDSKKNPHAGDSTSGNAEAGAAGAEHGGAGPGEGGSGGKATVGGAGGGGTSGASTGTPSAGGVSTTGAGAGADGIGGGTSSGGASTGGASTVTGTGGASTVTGTGGASTVTGTGGATLIDPPPNCESVRRSADAETCSYEYTCDARTHFDSCSRDDDGVWACECGTFGTAKRYFELEGVEALEACSVIAHVCESEDVPVSATRTCRPNDSSTVESGACSARASCGNELDLGNGIVARTVERYQSDCKPSQYSIYPDGSFDCTCASDASGSDNYLVTAPSIDDVCEPMVTVCTTEQEVVFSGRICGFSGPWGIVEQTCPSDPNCQGCASDRLCRRTAPIAPDVSIIDTDNVDARALICRREEGELRCTCPRMIEGVYGDETVPTEILDVCRESTAICPP
jgi:hypothetical protein